ncbi:hypothetical protein M758_3G068000 [Ceratodon purpureus]|uniref:Uncharacterized protein n=1 Tax=Ceratodon purpureus TaxID=3225 RepID=A0A8T0IFP6_CERPU|nr:hypothetical protein KC19_3G068500 [Ceratodon purpureus]KAG0622053.1 hypothetical protein M758_3G068000 [Ceratodon purpureus]
MPRGGRRGKGAAGSSFEGRDWQWRWQGECGMEARREGFGDRDGARVRGFNAAGGRERVRERRIMNACQCATRRR